MSAYHWIFQYIDIFWSRYLYGGHDGKNALNLNSWINTTETNDRPFWPVLINASTQFDLKTIHTPIKVDYFSPSTGFLLVYTHAREIIENGNHFFPNQPIYQSMVDRFSLSKGLLFEQKLLGRKNRIRGPRSSFFDMKHAIFLRWCYSLMVVFTGRQGTLFPNTYPNVHKLPRNTRWTFFIFECSF